MNKIEFYSEISLTLGASVNSKSSIKSVESNGEIDEDFLNPDNLFVSNKI